MIMLIFDANTGVLLSQLLFTDKTLLNKCSLFLSFFGERVEKKNLLFKFIRHLTFEMEIFERDIL